MTREEALNKYPHGWLENGSYNDYPKDEIVNSIYDDFESRTCESCEYCSKFDATLSYNGLRCDFGLGTINEYGSIFTELDFGCNKWKKK